jgi:RimJ/RimL family protein N-acetyltransferase
MEREPGTLLAIEWQAEGERLVAMEPTEAEIDEAAASLADFYNEPHNRRMMAHEEELSAADVRAYYRELREEGGRPFLLYRQGEGEPPTLVGDADVRNIEGETGEVAIMIGGRDVQGRGLGTRFMIMVHAFAFRALNLDRIYVSIIQANAASRRVFEKLGYLPDDSPAARDLADDETDVTLSLERARFEAARAAELGAIRVFARDRA